MEQETGNQDDDRPLSMCVLWKGYKPLQDFAGTPR